MKKISSLFLRISITFALLIFLLSKTDIGALFSVIKRADPFWILSAFLLFIFLNFLILLRWRLLLGGLSLRVPFFHLLSTYLASLFFNLVLPSTIGGDTVRTLEIADHTKRHSSNVLATVILDRLCGFFGLFTVLLAALLFGYRLLHQEGILAVTFILLLLMAFLVGIMFSGRFFKIVFGALPFVKFKNYLCSIHEATYSFRRKKRVLAGAWLFSVLIQGGLSVMYFFLAEALGISLDPVYFFLFVPIITVFSVIPISIGGLGVRDTTAIAVFAKVGVVAEKAFAMALLNFGFMFVLGIFGGIAYVFGLYRRRI